MPRMNDSPAAWIAFWLASEIMPASATTVTSVRPVGGLEGVDHRQHRVGLDRVALERRHGQREPGRVGEQPEGDLRVHAAFLGEPGLAESVTGIGFEIQGAHVVEHQRRRTQPGMLGARRRQCLTEGIFGEVRQPPGQQSGRTPFDTGLCQHPQRVGLAGRLDDAGQRQVPEHLVTTGRAVQAEHLVGTA